MSVDCWIVHKVFFWISSSERLSGFANSTDVTDSELSNTRYETGHGYLTFWIFLFLLLMNHNFGLEYSLSTADL